MREAIPDFLPSSPVTLGLDLSGGSHVLLEVDQADLEDQLSRQLIGDIRQTMREERIRYSGLGRQNGSVSVRITEAADFDRAYETLRDLAQPVSVGFFSQGDTAPEFDVSRRDDHIVFAFTTAGVEARINRAIDQSLEIVGQRINALGTTEPTIQRQGLNRILVQVPGLDDPERVKDILGRTARLQFRLLCDDQPQQQGERPPPECDALPDTDPLIDAHVGEEAHGDALRPLHLLLRQPGSVLDRLLNVVTLEVRVAGEDLVKRRTMGDLADDHGHGNPHAADARPATELTMVECDAFEHRSGRDFVARKVAGRRPAGRCCVECTTNVASST
jgi:hypothetical protein